VTVTVSWYVDGRPVKVGRTLKLRAAWRGRSVSYIVTARARGCQAVTVRSKAVTVAR
jgi:hypothetical protein